MNNQNTNTKPNINKLVAFTFVLLSIFVITFSFFTISNTQLSSRADDSTTTEVSAPAASTPATVKPAEAPTVKATSTSPAITAIKSTDTQVTGASVANATIELKDANGNAISCKNAPITSDSNGIFNCQLASPLSANTVVSATATESGKNTSSPANATVTEGVAAPVASTPAFDPLTINGGLVQFNVPDSLKNSTTPNQYNANFSTPSLGDWKLVEGAAIPGLAGMMPVLAQKDGSNYLSTFLSNQSPEIANKPTTRIVLDQAALDAASGVVGFKPVEIGGLSNLVRIPNLSTPATDDWWYIPKADIETAGYNVQAGDVSNVGTPEATMAFYKGNVVNQATPVAGETLPYSFLLQGTPASYGPAYNFALNGKASSPDNLNSMDNIVRGSTFDNSGYKFSLPKINLPKLGVPGIPQVGTPNGWDWSWLWPLLLLLALFLFLLWLLGRLFGWFGAKEDTSKYSSTYTGINNNFKKKDVNYTTTNVKAATKATYTEEVYVPKATPVETPKYVAPVYEAPKPKYEAPAYEAPKAKTVSPAAAAAVTAAAAYTVEKVAQKAMPKHAMKKDDLKVVEGIGPVIESNLHDAGILTYEDLANTTEAEIEKILAPITNNFTVFNCSTWAEQAQLAADGKFDELQKLKDILDKGVRR
jgi:predicted flap endonuclease-1-like 5' DNA nuclease/biopolymer transport protein ExbD